jgi:hypothetical protein
VSPEPFTDLLLNVIVGNSFALRKSALFTCASRLSLPVCTLSAGIEISIVDAEGFFSS